MFDKEKVSRLLAVMPGVKRILVESDDLETVRTRLLAQIDRFIDSKIDKTLFLSGLQYSLRLSCVRAFRHFFSRRTVKITGFDLMKTLWHLARAENAELPENLSDAFLEDVYRLLSGVVGKAGVYKPEPESTLSGREAGIARSEALNEMCRESDAQIEKFRCGLEEDIVALRKENRRRIQVHFSCSDEQFSDYQWQLKNIIRDSQTLGQLIELSSAEKEAIDRARQAGIPFGITPYYATLFDRKTGGTFDMAVRTQVIPPLSYVDAVLRNRQDTGRSLDFMKEGDTSPIDLITRRYPRIVVFKPYNTCSQICVYCQRNWEIDDVYAPGAMASREKIDAAIDWIAANPTVSEVLLTGGDPLVMSDANIRYILEKIAAIGSVLRIRIGTRTPVALPQRITDELVTMIAGFHEPGRREVALVTHFEHVSEITPEAMQAIQRFRQRGMSCYNQTVFTIQNCRRFEVSALRKWLRLIGVEPYYTFNAKGKEETDFYRVPLARLQQEAKEEARLQPGLTRTDEPVYNVPGLGKNYLRAEQNHLLLTILPDGRRVYEFHPWEKFISHAESYIHYDIPIYDFLQKLAGLGENPDDYASIYYYF